MKLYTILRNLIQSIKNALQEAKDYSDARGDYIVEEGTSGIWTYRKWASGIAECWGRQTFSSTTSTSVNVNGYIPNGIMDTTTQKEIFASGAFDGITDSRVGYTRCSNAGRYDVYLLRSSSANVGGEIKMSINGLWKTFTQVGGVILNLLNNRRVVFA